MTSKSSPVRIRPLVKNLSPYVPGEQPKIKGLIKLNTNENPYPPSPKTLSQVKAAVDDRLRLYPNPSADPLREKLAQLHGCKLENIIVGNGSDELLAMAVRCFVDPAIPHRGKGFSTVQYFDPSYSLYPVLAAIHGADINPVPLGADFEIPSVQELNRGRLWDFHAALSLITTPNAPSGRGYATADLEKLVRRQRGITVLDEAYVDFASEDAMDLALRYPHVLVARTFSKAYSLCFQRVGYMVGSEPLISALHKIRDSYNVNGLGQVAALATLDDLPYYRAKFKAIIAARQAVSQELAALGFKVFPSQTNFILVQPPGAPAEAWQKALREQKILVRWFNSSQIRQFLRITIGTTAEMSALVKAVKSILPKLGSQVNDQA